MRVSTASDTPDAPTVSGLPLVTGATGFAGSHLVRHLLESHDAVEGWANPGGRDAPHGDSRIRWRRVDILDRAAVVEALRDARPSAVYHCAGIAHVGHTWADPTRALQVNVLGTHHLLDGLRDAGLHDRPVLVTGSALVYRQSSDAIAEEHPIGPESPYGVSKLAQEMLAQRASDLHPLLARPFNHAGPGQDDTYVTSSFARQIAEIETGLREPVLHVGNLDARRDITDVRDTVRAYRLMVERGQPHRPYNVSRGMAYRVADLLDLLVSMSHAALRVQADPARMRPSDTPIVLGESSRLARETGWAPSIPIEQTLADLLDDWRARVTALG
jgi:GDP-4-dehydro-6-deoxy-D-mannose reductase